MSTVLDRDMHTLHEHAQRITDLMCSVTVHACKVYANANAMQIFAGKIKLSIRNIENAECR